MNTSVGLSGLARWFEDHDHFVLIGHLSPDGDSAGCCMALSLALRSMGKQVCVALPDRLPGLFSFLPDASRFLTPDDPMPFEPECAVALDVSSQERMGRLTEVYFNCPASCTIDHHKSNPGFGDICFVDGERVACGEIIAELIVQMHVQITETIAQWLFVAISTDSGHFRFRATSPHTFELAAMLMRAGIDLQDLTQRLWNTRSASKTRLLGKVLSELELSEDGKIAWAKVTRQMVRDCASKPEEKDGIVNYLIEIEGVEIACLAEERPDGTKFSLRSKSDAIDVSEGIARKLGGGGHAQAAGCMLSCPIDEALIQVLSFARATLAYIHE